MNGLTTSLLSCNVGLPEVLVVIIVIMLTFPQFDREKFAFLFFYFKNYISPSLALLLDNFDNCLL